MSDEQTQQAILNQVEFYFSESNLLNDRFLFTTQNANDGWVPIQTISQFERMKKYRPIENIIEALRKSTELLEVSENGEMVRRKIPLPKNYNEIQININKRSIHVDKLPTESTLDDLLTFFRTIAPVNQVRMKKNKERAFTGSCIVEFKNAEDAEKILNDQNENKLKFGDVELDIVSKAAYDESKAQKFGERRGGKGKKNNNKRGRKDSKEESKDDDKKRDASPVRTDEPAKERKD